MKSTPLENPPIQRLDERTLNKDTCRGKACPAKTLVVFLKVCFIHLNGVLHISLVPCDKACVQIEAKCMEGIYLAKTFKLPR